MQVRESFLSDDPAIGENSRVPVSGEVTEHFGGIRVPAKMLIIGTDTGIDIPNIQVKFKLKTE